MSALAPQQRALAPEHPPAARRGTRPAWQGTRERRSALALAGIALLIALGTAGFTALGVWQLERRVWKLDLISRVDHRVHAPPVATPGPAEWTRIDAASAEYRHVEATGRFLYDRETLVRAVTKLGGGYWVMTPFRTARGFIVLVNRGFVPPQRRDRATRAASEMRGPTTVTGLLRLTEPKGAFLHANDPAADRWYSRDVAAIAAARHLSDVAPFFIDADASSSGDTLTDAPVGGLTVVSFPNNHLLYALTWFGLASMVVGAGALVGREEWRLRPNHP